ncbi:hypothetical protein AKJ41_04870 [candidate division MSBL1 archaeon SCGC-AAA259O05]|uniref:Peptidase A2 domain-containing protein n=1 Tax=candidate division MSBL1 archaeon SCGC-AAA259O05 TaxID=1698271 RepID=A0A133V032_9EURY|nr:hypothetical protein AKJ41_04870 [candidate division MSBL1 archaeon SCGC-AAA259O05]
MDYDKDYFSKKPAPFLEVEISDPKSIQTTSEDAILDSGSFISTIPPHIAEELPLTIRGNPIPIYGELKETVYVCLSFLEFSFYKRIALWKLPKGHAVIGRDILNELKVVLDGKNFNFEIIDC